MKTNVIETVVSYVSDSSFKNQVFIACEDVLRPEKKFNKGFFIFKNQLLVVLHNLVAGFSMLPQSVPLKQLWQILKGAAIVVNVDTYEEGEELPGEDSDVVDETTYYTTVKSIVLSDEGKSMLQQLFQLGMFSTMGMEKYAVKMIQQMAANIGGEIVVEDAATDTHDDTKIADFMRKDVKRSSLSDEDKAERDAYLAAGNHLV